MTQICPNALVSRISFHQRWRQGFLCRAPVPNTIPLRFRTSWPCQPASSANSSILGSQERVSVSVLMMHNQVSNLGACRVWHSRPCILIFSLTSCYSPSQILCDSQLFLSSNLQSPLRHGFWSTLFPLPGMKQDNMWGPYLKMQHFDRVNNVKKLYLKKSQVIEDILNSTMYIAGFRFLLY